MADHAGEPVDYWAAVPERYEAALFPLRRWSGLKLGTANGRIWLRGFTAAEIASPTVLSIPGLERYYLKEARLYPVGKSLPALVEPTVLWTDLRRGLKVRLPAENHNYFGVGGTHGITLVPATEPRPTAAALLGLSSLAQYLHTAPRVRALPLRWTVLDDEHALVMGTPLLPVPGKDYYRLGGFLLPAGWKLQYETMAGVYREALGNSREYWYLLDEDNTITKIRKDDFAPLSKGSFVKTIQP